MSSDDRFDTWNVDACVMAAHETIRQFRIASGITPEERWDELPAWRRVDIRKSVRDVLSDAHDGNGDAVDILFTSVVRAMATALGMPHTPTSQCAKGVTPNLDYERGYHDAVRDIAKKIREHRPADGVAKE